MAETINKMMNSIKELNEAISLIENQKKEMEKSIISNLLKKLPKDIREDFRIFLRDEDVEYIFTEDYILFMRNFYVPYEGTECVREAVLYMSGTYHLDGWIGNHEYEDVGVGFPD